MSNFFNFFFKKFRENLIIKSSSPKIISALLNYINLVLLLNVFSKEQFAQILLVEMLVGLLMAFLIANQNNLLIRKAIGEGLLDSKFLIHSSFAIKTLVTLLGFFLLIFLYLIIDNFDSLNFLKFSSFYFYLYVYLYSIFIDLCLLLSLIFISREKYIKNFFLIVFLPFSTLLSIILSLFINIDLEFYFFSKLLILIIIFLIFLIYSFEDNKDEHTNKSRLYRNYISYVFSKQFPLSCSALYSTSTYSLPVFLFGYQNMNDSLVILGIIDRTFNPYKNGLSALIGNINPFLFKKYKSLPNIKEFSRTFIKNIKPINFLVFFGFMILSAISVLILIFQINIELTSLVILVLLRFMTIFPFITQTYINIIFFAEERTSLIAFQNVMTSSINLLNIYASFYGLISVLLVYFLARFIPSLISLQYIRNYKLIYSRILIVSFFSFIPIACILFFNSYV